MKVKENTAPQRLAAQARGNVGGTHQRVANESNHHTFRTTAEQGGCAEYSHAEILIQACIEFLGAAPPEHLLFSKPNRWLRVATADDRKGRKSAALKVISKPERYYLMIIKNHKTGFSKTVTTRRGQQALMTPKEKALAAQQRRELERLVVERSLRKHRMLSGMSRRIWRACLKPGQWEKPHPYIQNKQVLPHNVRRWMSHKRDVLVLPMIEPMVAQIMSLYLIYPGGFKRPLKGSQTQGLCMAIGENLEAASVLWCTEGYATACSLHEHTKEPVIVAFTAANLEPVTAKMIQKYPDAAIRVCADDDRKTFAKHGFNPGMDYAKKVQQAHPCVSLWRPVIPEDAPMSVSDVNDIVNLCHSPIGGAS